MRALSANSLKFKTIIIALITVLCITSLEQLKTILNALYPEHDDVIVSTARSDMGLSDDMATTIDNFTLHACFDKSGESIKYNPTVSEMAKLFQVKEGSWELTHKPGSSAMTLRFQIIECPQRYAASTFHVQARTNNTVFTGSVGHRYKVEEGCGYYNATVPILPSAVLSGRVNGIVCHNSTVDPPSLIIEAFWTSEYRNYVNRLEDMEKAQYLYEHKHNMTMDDISELLGPARLHYLMHHLDILPSFPIGLELPDNLLDSLQLKPRENMTNCSDVPIKDWLPVGIVNNFASQDKSLPYFQSHKCKYRSLNRQELQYWFAGMRVKYMGDSHGQYENNYVFRLTCPEAKTTTNFFNDKYSCSMPSEVASQSRNSFAFAWKFYRGMLKATGGDRDAGLSSLMRQATETACAKFFGIGFYNATVITTPSWPFVYETTEGLYDYLHSLKNAIEYCRRKYPEEMDKLILLVQSPVASDVMLPEDPLEIIKWRNNHNFLEEPFTEAMYSELDGLVDGIIPVFQWTLARNWMQNTVDGVHLQGPYYEEIFHVQTMAIMSAMRSKGWRVPVVSENDEQARWFDGIPLE
jgi:hypothetical protein